MLFPCQDCGHPLDTEKLCPICDRGLKPGARVQNTVTNQLARVVDVKRDGFVNVLTVGTKVACQSRVEHVRAVPVTVLWLNVERPAEHFRGAIAAMKRVRDVGFEAAVYDVGPREEMICQGSWSPIGGWRPNNVTL